MEAGRLTSEVRGPGRGRTGRVPLFLIALAFAACGSGSTSNPVDDATPELGGDVLPLDGVATDEGVTADRVEDEAAEGTQVETLDDVVEAAEGTVDAMDETLPEVATDVAPVEIIPPCVGVGPCDDGDPCTQGDRCTDGVCKGKAYTCDDKRDCTDNVCDGYGGCQYPIKAAACLINNVCYVEGEASPLSACVRCDPAMSVTELSVAPNGTACGAGPEDPCLAPGSCADGQCSAGPADCDDGNPCTDDKCVAGTGCTHTPNFDPCEDGDPCTLGDQCKDGKCVTGFMPLDCYDGDPCTLDLCTPNGCEHPAVDAPCDDGDECTDGDHCMAGACVPGDPLNCNDGNDCTTDACDPAVGCRHTMINSPCCAGAQNICDDKNPCTKDVCDPATGACSHTPYTGNCNDGDACTGPDTCGDDGVCKGPPKDCDDKNPCTTDACDPKTGCTHKVVQGACDDGSACTTGDVCLPNGVCSGKPISCDDKNPCTKDSCNPATGCAHETLTGACSDGSACTTGDTCVGTTCTGTSVNCDDGNPCTADSCHPTLGCQHTQVTGACDDGKACTVNDQCVAGKCVGTQQGLCCTPDFSSPVNRLTNLELGTGGQPGEALDVDGNKNTCAPPDNCTGGLDNSLGSLAGVANPELAKAFAKGTINLLFEHRGFRTDGVAYTLAFYSGKKVDDACDNLTQSCAYQVTSDFIDSSCQPKYGFKNAKVTGTKLTAGGVGYNWPLSIPISSTITLNVTVANTQIVADLTMSGGKPVGITGLLAGAVPKKAMVDAINAIPDDQLPISKQGIIDMLSAFVVNDIDTDGDGNLDGVSVGVKFTGIGGTISGVAQ